MRKLATLTRSAIVAACATASIASFADGLPAGYTQLPYISADGQCQIKTGYTPAATDKIVMTWVPKTVSGNQCLWCARNNTASQSFTSFAYGAKVGLVYNSTTLGEGAAPSTFDVTKRDNIVESTRYTIIADGNAKTLAVTNAFTGAEVANVSWTVANNFDVGSELCLFASHTTKINSPGNYASHYLYSFKVYDAAGNLKLNLVPAKNSSGTIGLYNTVGESNNFLTKSNGSGSLSDAPHNVTFADDFTFNDDEVFGTVTVESGKTLDLNGHNLTVRALAGDGTITAGLLDLTSPDPDGERVTWNANGVAQGAIHDGNSTPLNLFNNNYNRDGTDNTKRIIVQTVQLPLAVTYDFGAETPKKVDMYKVYVGPLGDAYKRGPKSWTFEGTDDTNGVWTTLHTRAGETWPVAQETRTYTFENATAYRFYRFTFISSVDTEAGAATSTKNYLECVQLEYFDSSDALETPSELRVNVPANMSLTNSTVEIDGSIRLVKDGSGEFVAARGNQTYTEGNRIVNGTLTPYSAYAADLLLGANGSDVIVESGAVFDINGMTRCSMYRYVMNGGTALNNGANIGGNYAQLGDMTLTADSYLDSTHSLGFIKAGNSALTIDLGGKALEVSVGNETRFVNATITNGTLRLVRGTGGNTVYFTTAASRAETATLDMDSHVGTYYDLPVSNLILRAGFTAHTSATANGTYKVYGTFKTETGNFPFVKMMDGSTLDLKDRSDAFNVVSTSANPSGLKILFDSGATVTVDIAGRTPSVGDCLISWDAIPAGVTFQFDAETAAGGVEPVATERGLLYGFVADTVEQAWWTGAANDGDIANPANWLCKNAVGDTVTGASALPTAVTHIYLEGSLNINDSTNLAFVCRVCTLTNATFTGDCDLRGIGAALEIAPNATINLNGNKFYVSAAAQIGTCTIRDLDPVDLTTTDTSRVAVEGTFYNGTVGANLFNNNYSREADKTHRILIATNALPVSIAYDFGEPTLVDAYRIWTGPIKNGASRLPMQWKIEGSNDGTEWTLLDYRKGVSSYGTGNGHRTYSFANAAAYNRYRITFEAAQWDSDGYLEAVQLEYFRLKATQGELHIDTTGVSGEVVFAGLSLDGNMRLFKEGAGTIRLSKAEQTHIGGMEVLGGTVVNISASSANQAAFGERGGDVVIRGDNSGTASATCGVVDFEAKEGYTSYRYILDGGAIYNPGLAVVTDIRLVSDSWLKLTSTTPENGTNYVGRAVSPSFVELCGHTLSMDIATGGRTFYLYNTMLDDGLLDVVNGGWFGTRGTVVATNASVRVVCGVDVNGTFLLRDYAHLQTTANYNRGAGVIDVYGTLSTHARLFHGTLLHDGSTIDLATDYVLSDPLPTVAVFKASQTGDKTLRFEPGARIGVKLGSRTVAKGACVISWTAETAPDSTVKFVPADADRRYRLEPQADGLYYYPPRGMLLIVR